MQQSIIIIQYRGEFFHPYIYTCMYIHVINSVLTVCSVIYIYQVLMCQITLFSGDRNLVFCMYMS